MAVGTDCSFSVVVEINLVDRDQGFPTLFS